MCPKSPDAEVSPTLASLIPLMRSVTQPHVQGEWKIRSLAGQLPGSMAPYNARTQAFHRWSSISTKELLSNSHKLGGPRNLNCKESYTVSTGACSKYTHASNTPEWSSSQCQIIVRNFCQKRFPFMVPIQPSVITQNTCMHIPH